FGWIRARPQGGIAQRRGDPLDGERAFVVVDEPKGCGSGAGCEGEVLMEFQVQGSLHCHPRALPVLSSRAKRGGRPRRSLRDQAAGNFLNQSRIALRGPTVRKVNWPAQRAGSDVSSSRSLPR